MAGKKKIEIKKIDDKVKRSVTFTKRRQGLFKKAGELCRLTGANICLVVFSPAGTPFTFGYPSLDEVFDEFPVREEEVKDDWKMSRSENGDGFWWNDINMDDLDTLEKINAVRDQLFQVKNLVIKRKEELIGSPTSSAAGTEATTDDMADSCMSSIKEDDDSLLESINFDDIEEQDDLFSISIKRCNNWGN